MLECDASTVDNGGIYRDAALTTLPSSANGNSVAELGSGENRAMEYISHTGVVEGHRVKDILLDTKCSQTFVRKDLVPNAHGDTVLYPLAMVAIEVDGISLQVKAAAAETLVAFLQGTDVPELGELLSKRSIGNQPTAKGADVTLVTTCAQAKKIAEEERGSQT